MRHGGLPVLLDAHALAVDRVTAYRLIDGAATGQHPVTDCQVVPGNLPIRQLAYQCCMGRQGLGNEQQAGRVLVDPVDNACAWHFLEPSGRGATNHS